MDDDEIINFDLARPKGASQTGGSGRNVAATLPRGGHRRSDSRMGGSVNDLNRAMSPATIETRIDDGEGEKGGRKKFCGKKMVKLSLVGSSEVPGVKPNKSCFSSI